MRNVYKILDGKTERKRSLRRGISPGQVKVAGA
jgi:hypothetical protein